MVIIITGASHTGKTALAQRVLEKYHIPYLSIDHIKMGLIRSGNTQLTPLSSDYVKLHFQEIKKYADIAEKGWMTVDIRWKPRWRKTGGS